MGPRKAELMTEQLLKRIDINGNGCIDFSEFLLANMNQETDLISGNLKSAFDIYDCDNNETLTAEELGKWLSEYLDSDPAFVENIISQLDKNGDGAINFDEFCEFMQM